MSERAYERIRRDIISCTIAPSSEISEAQLCTHYKLGKASVTGYCIKFSTLRNIDLAVLEAAIRDGIAQTTA